MGVNETEAILYIVQFNAKRIQKSTTKFMTLSETAYF